MIELAARIGGKEGAKRSWFTKGCKPFRNGSPKKLYRAETREILTLKHKLGIAALLIGAALFAPSCNAAPANYHGGNTNLQKATSKGNSVSANSIPINQRFRNLHEYLAWLEKTQAPVDGAWYRKIGPNQYELQTGNLRIMGEDGTEKKIFTYEELAKQFGFER